MKQNSPLAIILITAGLLGAVLGAAMYLHPDIPVEPQVAVAFGFGVFVLIAGAMYVVVERLINRRLKLIYKTIHQAKITPENDVKADLTKDVFASLEQEVRHWETEHRSEIERLKVQETYRREFIGNVAHELKTPIFNIQGYVLTLLEGGLEDERINRDYLERTSRSVERMISIVSDLDQITQYEAGQLLPDLKKFDLVALVKDVFKSLEMRAKNAQVNLSFKEDYRTTLSVLADERKIRQVLVNLIVNAINYGKAGGTVEVRFHTLDKLVITEVADDGIGIEEKHLSRLFERFYRVDSSRSRDRGGSGLGLAIVKHIIEAHKQAINVRSTVGIGTTFSFTLQKV